MNIDDIFWLAHDGLPRQAPGSPDTTRLLLRLAGPLPDRPRIVDIGCGTGASALVLTAETGGTLTAVDTHAPFLAQLAGAERVTPLNAPMQDLPLGDGSADLVWAEGSAYIMGFDAALRAWRRLLAPGGALVLTEAEWTTLDPAPGARAFWDAGYPAMRTTDANVRAALAAGWTVAATYLLPDSDWDAYYEPLAARVARLRGELPDAMVALDEVEREIHIRREHRRGYGYTAYVLRRQPAGNPVAEPTAWRSVMGADDKFDNKAEELKGTAKEKIGEATDDKSLEAEGRADRIKGSLKQAGEKVKDAFRRKH